jgi:hypothetical protein
VSSPKSPSPELRRSKALRIVAYSVLGLLLVPVALFFAFYFAVGGPAADHGHPPAIILPYLYAIFGFRFLAPLGALAGLLSLRAGRLDEPADGLIAQRRRVGVVSIALAVGCVAAWLHSFR